MTTADYTWGEWLWLCLFAGGAFYMVAHLSYLLGRWFWPKGLPTRYTIPIGLGDEQNRISVWAYSLERAIVKAAAKDSYQYLIERLNWMPMPWLKAQRINLAWLAGYGWTSQQNIQRQQQGGIDSLIMMLVDQCADRPRNCWAHRRGLWLLCLRSAELEACSG